jgi:hypothetical protein
MHPERGKGGWQFVSYLEAYLGRPEFRLRNCRVAIKVSKSTAVLFAKAAGRVRKARQLRFSESQ